MRAILLAIILSGCSTVGDLEVLNDIGGGTVRSTASTIDSSCKVITGHSCDKQQLNTSNINRTYGEVKQLKDYVGADNLEQILQELMIAP